MSRKPRVWFPGAIYHITSRGNRRSSIFYDTDDRYKYLSFLEEAKTLYPFTLYSYCLMSNHIHLQVETIEHHPKEFMKRLNMKYAIYFNKKYDLTGHLFQDRYRADLIDSLQYLVEVSRYIYLNPVRAAIVSKPEDYKWSSYLAFISKKKNPHVDPQKILFYFGKPSKKNYRLYVESGDAPTVLA